jgi:hypothetical protein
LFNRPVQGHSDPIVLVNNWLGLLKAPQVDGVCAAILIAEDKRVVRLAVHADDLFLRDSSRAKADHEEENVRNYSFHATSILFDRGEHNIVALRARSVEDEEREASVARDDAEFGVGGH